MKPLIHSRAAGINDALALAGDPASAFLAGGTNELDLLRAGISHSDHLVEINDRPLTGVEDRADGGLHIGALARMSDVRSGAVVPVGPLPTPNPCESASSTPVQAVLKARP
jgi:xanthine dehydrogenase YagS FAD-binding subunit